VFFKTAPNSPPTASTEFDRSLPEFTRILGRRQLRPQVKN
jgi:hypothetical protein